MTDRSRLRVPLITDYLASSVGAGVGLADCDEETTGAVSKTFISRLSAILQMDASLLNDALHQAQRDAQDTSGERMLDLMFQRRRISKELKDRCLVWFQSRPQGFPYGRRAIVMREELILLRVDRMLQLGLISQDSADQFLGWFHSRPEGLPHGKRAVERNAKGSTSGSLESDRGLIDEGAMETAAA